MIFAHLNGQISASIETYPYCFMSEEANINPFAAENEGERWADTPRFPDPSLCNIQIQYKKVIRYK